MVNKDFSFVRGDTFSINVTISKLNKIENLTNIYFTIKRTFEDKKPIIQKKLSTGGIVFLGEEDEKTKYNILINATDSDNMKIDTDYVYDLEIVAETLKKTLMKGKIRVEADVTRTSNE